MKNYSIKLAQSIQWSLEKMDLRAVSFDEQEGKFEFVREIAGPFSFLFYTIDVSQMDYTVLAFCPAKVVTGDATAMGAAARFVCFANHRSKRGGLELDFETGYLRYKHFVDCSEQIPSHRTVSDSICTPSIVLQSYAPAIIDVFYRGKDPKCALDDCVEDLVRRCEDAKRTIAELLQKMGDVEHEEDPDDEDDDS